LSGSRVDGTSGKAAHQNTTCYVGKGCNIASCTANAKRDQTALRVRNGKLRSVCIQINNCTDRPKRIAQALSISSAITVHIGARATKLSPGSIARPTPRCKDTHAGTCKCIGSHHRYSSSRDGAEQQFGACTALSPRLCIFRGHNPRAVALAPDSPIRFIHFPLPSLCTKTPNAFPASRISALQPRCLYGFLTIIYI
jgi:hypothetical protein